jgi:hypothetical protein
MDLNGFNAASWMVLGVLSVVGLANLVDFGLRTMAEKKAQRAELARFRQWGLPAPKFPDEPARDEHLWHF